MQAQARADPAPGRCLTAVLFGYDSSRSLANLSDGCVPASAPLLPKTMYRAMADFPCRGAVFAIRESTVAGERAQCYGGHFVADFSTKEEDDGSIMCANPGST